jgi:hypothetical protein
MVTAAERNRKACAIARFARLELADLPGVHRPPTATSGGPPLRSEATRNAPSPKTVSIALRARPFEAPSPVCFVQLQGCIINP